MRGRTALCLVLLSAFLASQSGCFTLTALGEHPRSGREMELAVTLLAVEIVAWPALIADVMIATAICASKAESRRQANGGAPAAKGTD